MSGEEQSRGEELLVDCKPLTAGSGEYDNETATEAGDSLK